MNQYLRDKQSNLRNSLTMNTPLIQINSKNFLSIRLRGRLSISGGVILYLTLIHFFNLYLVKYHCFIRSLSFCHNQKWGDCYNKISVLQYISKF